MTSDGYVFPADMSPGDMERRKNSMMLTGSVFTKCKPVYELADGTPMFTFLVQPTEPSPDAGDMGSVSAQVKTEFQDYDMTQSEPPVFSVSGGQTPVGGRVVPPGKKNQARKSAQALPGPQPLETPHPPSPASRLSWSLPRPSTSQVRGPPLLLHHVREHSKS
jgi:hypothetical protein